MAKNINTAELAIINKLQLKADALLDGMTPDNIIKRMGERNALLIKIEAMRERLRHSQVQLPMDYGLTIIPNTI